jgi:hypothetical protein
MLLVALVAGLGTNTVAGSVALVTWAAAGLLVQADQGGRTGEPAGAT